jgi:hypothetical protein
LQYGATIYPADTPTTIAFSGVLDRKEGSANSSCYV